MIYNENKTGCEFGFGGVFFFLSYGAWKITSLKGEKDFYRAEARGGKLLTHIMRRRWKTTAGPG